MDWRLKGTIQKALGYVPGGRRIHYQLQRKVGGLVDFGRECDLKVDDWRLMMGHLRARGIDVRGARLVEIGTGRAPTLALSLYLAGAAKVFSLDLLRLVEHELVLDLADRLMIHVAAIAQTAGRPEPEVTALQRGLVDALGRSASLAVATGNVVDYRAPADATETGLPAGSVDIVFSSGVLEHMRPHVIEASFAEARRLLRPGGVMFHSVNCGDHYAYADAKIDQLHYLRFSDDEWERWNNDFLYQNRLRAKDFTAMASAAGFTIEVDTSRAIPQRLAQLDKITVHSRFAGYTREELAVTTVDFVARKA